MVLLLCALLAPADGLPPLAELPPLKAEAWPSPSPFKAAVAEASKAGKPLAVFVGQPAPALSGWLTLRDDGLDQPSPCVVILHRGEWLRLRGRRTAGEVRGVVESAPVYAPPSLPPPAAYFPTFRPTARSGC